MRAQKDFGFGKIIEKLIKDISSKFFAEGANALADKISPTASKLLRDGSPEGGKLMRDIRDARKLRK